jgi:hypothetical protein
MRQTVESPRSRGGGALSGSGSGLTREPRSLPLDAPKHNPGSNRSQHGTLFPGEEEAPRSESGAKMQPVSQRDRGDGLSYIERVSRRKLPHTSLRPPFYYSLLAHRIQLDPSTRQNLKRRVGF